MPTVLVVDDEDTIRTLICRGLARQGYTVLSARDGVEALEVSQAMTGPIDLLVTDLAMPRMGGLEAARILGATRPNMSILLTTGYVADAEAAETAIAAGARLLKKPFSLDVLRTEVETLIQPRPSLEAV